MLSVENNELWIRVGPGTSMGTRMRYYWQPVCAMDELLRSQQFPLLTLSLLSPPE